MVVFDLYWFRTILYWSCTESYQVKNDSWNLYYLCTENAISGLIFFWNTENELIWDFSYSNLFMYKVLYWICTFLGLKYMCVLNVYWNLTSTFLHVLKVYCLLILFFSIVKMLKYTKNVLFFNLDFYYTWKVYWIHTDL